MSIFHYTLSLNEGAFLQAVNDDAGHNYVYNSGAGLTRIVSGKAVTQDTASHMFEYVPPTPIGYMSIKIFTVAATGLGVYVRSYGPGDSIAAVLTPTGSPKNSTVTLYRYSGGTPTTLSSANIDWVAGDKLGLYDDGTNVSVYQNDVAIIGPTAVSFQAGAPAVGWFETASTAAGGTVLSEIDFSASVPSGSSADHLAFTTQPVGNTSGLSLAVQPVVAAKKADGTTDASFGGTVTITLSGTGSLGGTATKSFVSGVATFTDLTITGAGTSQLVATRAPLTSATSNTVTTGASGGGGTAATLSVDFTGVTNGTSVTAVTPTLGNSVRYICGSTGIAPTVRSGNVLFGAGAMEMATIANTSAADGGYPSADYRIRGTFHGYSEADFHTSLGVRLIGGATGTARGYMLEWYFGKWRFRKIWHDYPYSAIGAWYQGLSGRIDSYARAFPTGTHEVIVTVTGSVNPLVVAKVDGEVVAWVTDTGASGIPRSLAAGMGGVVGGDQYYGVAAPGTAWNYSGWDILPVPTTADSLKEWRVPAGAVAGSAFDLQPQVALVDGFQQPVTGVAATITATLESGAGALIGTLTAAVNTATGIATFATLGADTTGPKTIRYSTVSYGSLVGEGVTVVDSSALTARVAPALSGTRIDWDAGSITTVLAGMKLELWTGAQPTNLTDAPAGTKIGTMTLHDPAPFWVTASVSAGAMPTAKAAAIASGTPTYVRWVVGTTVMGIMPVGGAKGAILSNAAVVNGDRLQLNVFTLYDTSGLVTISTDFYCEIAVRGTMDRYGVSEKPRLVPDTTMPTQSGVLREIGPTKPYATWDAALAAAQWGEDVTLPMGTTFTGNFFLPYKAPDAAPTHRWIVVRAATVTNAEGELMTPTKGAALSLPRIQTADNSFSVTLRTQDGAHHYRLIGFEVGVAPTVTDCLAPIFFSALSNSPNGRSVDDIPHHIILDRMLIRGREDPAFVSRIGVEMSVDYGAIIYSWIDGIFSPPSVTDAFGINAIYARGPMLIEGCHVEAVTENMILGGDEAYVPGARVVMSDVTVRTTTFTKPARWKRVYENEKTIFEIKNARRVWLDGCVFDSNWDAPAAAGGHWGAPAITLKSVNQNHNPTSPHVGAQDITITNCLIKRVTVGITAHPMPEQPATPLSRISIYNVLMIETGIAPSDNGAGGDRHFIGLGGLSTVGIHDFSCHHCTCVNTQGGFGDSFKFIVVGEGGQQPNERLIVNDNVMALRDGAVISGASYGYVDNNFPAYWGAGSEFRRNIIYYIVTDQHATYGTDNAYYTYSDPTFPGLFTDLAGGNYDLAPGHAQSTYATDGLAPGVNMTELTAALAAGALAPPAPAVATTLTVDTQPGNGTVTTTLLPQPVFRELDQYGAAFPALGSVTVTLNVVAGGLGAVLAGTTTRAFTSSVAGFLNLAVAVPGTYTITGTDQYGHSVTTVPFTIPGGPVGPAVGVAGIVVDVLPTTATRGVPFSPQPAGRVVDALGATVTSYNGSIKADVLGGRGRLATSGNTVRCVNGLWQFVSLTPLQSTPITLDFLLLG